MSEPKFAVGEVVLLRSREHPWRDAEHTVLAIRQGCYWHSATDRQVFGIAYKLDDGPGKHVWHESALRKHPGRDFEFQRFMVKTLDEDLLQEPHGIDIVMDILDDG